MNHPAPPRELIEKVKKLFQEKEQKRLDFIDRYGHIKPPNVIKAFDDKTVSVLEGGIYMQTRKQSYNFVNVIHDHALLFFGDAFLESEEAKQFEERHFAIQWMHAWGDHWNGNLADGKNESEIDQFGIGGAWFRFCNDLYTIRDNAKLEALLKKRLLNPIEFQSARHELRVAAICIAAGFNIEFEDETDNATKHPEFIAIDRFSEARIAVEAKSRRRRGVLGFSEGSTKPLGSTVGIKDIVLKAYKKVTDLPYFIFVDVNLPPFSNEEQYQTWLNEIADTMDELGSANYPDTCPANAVFFSNDPSHYIERQINNETDNLWICFFGAVKPRIPYSSEEIIKRLMRAYQQRVAPPENISDFIL